MGSYQAQFGSIAGRLRRLYSHDYHPAAAQQLPAIIKAQYSYSTVVTHRCAVSIPHLSPSTGPIAQGHRGAAVRFLHQNLLTARWGPQLQRRLLLLTRIRWILPKLRRIHKDRFRLLLNTFQPCWQRATLCPHEPEQNSTLTSTVACTKEAPATSQSASPYSSERLELPGVVSR